MRSTISCVLLFAFALAATVGVGFAATAGLVEPGGKIGAMKLVRGEEFDSDLYLFNVCNALTAKAGSYHRSCSVPQRAADVHRLGRRSADRKSLDESWKQIRWDLWIDGRPVRLASFGTADGAFRRFRPTGKPAFFRLWKVVLVGATPGKHTVRYRMRGAGGTTDDTLDRHCGELEFGPRGHPKTPAA